MTSYNYSKFIGQAIDSVFNQTYRDWELIIVDDGSTDNSVDIIKSYVEKFPEKVFLFFHENQSNKGISESNLLALSKARGKFCAFLESDDFWREDNLEKKISALKIHPKVSLVFSDVRLFGSEELRKTRYAMYKSYSRFVGRKLRMKPGDAFDFVYTRNPVLTLSNTVLRREHLRNVAKCDNLDTIFDWILVVQQAVKGNFFYLDEELVYWRVSSASAHNSQMKSMDVEIASVIARICFFRIVIDSLDRDDKQRFIRYANMILSLKYKYKQFMLERCFRLWKFFRK